MAPKKRKADPAESPVAASEAGAGTNHHQETPSSELKPRGTIYFPITDDPPEPSAEGGAEGEDGAGGDDDEEDIAKLLEPLSREQLVALLRTAAETTPATMAAVRRAAEADPASRKLFVHGLGWGAGADDLRSAFSRFGELEDCRVISDKQSGRSKGYGFVLFRSRRSALRALRRPQLQIGGRLAFCHLAASGPAPPTSQSQNPSSNTNANSGAANNAGSASSSQPDNMQRKIFVGNVHADVDVDRLYEYFSQFGEIEEGPLGFDKTTGKPKGFALFVYKSVESARRALEEPTRNFDGKMLNVQKAIDGRTKNTPGMNANSNPSGTAASAAAAAAAAQMTSPATAAITPYDASAYGATAVPDLGYAQQAAMLGLGAQQQAFAQPNAAMLAMMAAAMQNPAMLATLNPAFAAAALGAGGQQVHAAGIPGFGAQGFGTQGFAAGAAAFPNAAGVQAPPGFQGPPGFQTSAGFQVGQAASQAGTAAAAAASAAGYQAAAAGQGQVPGTQIGGAGFQGGF
ncbi:UBP1-associated protein 2B-like isoform X1 [Oryza glaberrima]|uniref:RRM domain-containing protein n=1 Tax=Oryza glaberrima TaxID=4538 RepID=I1PPQ0_ORYGL|nr:UBP1-associated protein 2B-like isoform X1 [Oryza glaberrima]XP_052153738.1 UBP1-associated protein 2B-like isoform X1 [Oryza glaberrima]